MLQKVGEDATTEQERIPITEAAFPMPFYEGLEYSSPARGVWNIAQTGLLIPEAHEIFVCAKGCLRGVVLTAAEMGALDRYSAIEVREENVLQGGMEELMIEGVTDILGKLSYRPRAVLLFISCQHFFLAYEQKPVFDALGERFPDIRFLDCYMIPTLRKSGMPPMVRMKVQMTRLWEKRPDDRKDEENHLTEQKEAAYHSAVEIGWKYKGSILGPEQKKVNLIGSNLPVAHTSELVRIVEEAGYELWEVQRCKTFDEYLAMAEARLNLLYEPAALPAAKDLKKRLAMDYLYLPFIYDFDALEETYGRLAEALETKKPYLSADRARAEDAIAHARELIGETPIAVDYTFTFRILSFARLLLTNGFQVTEIFADSFVPEEETDFIWIREHHPEVTITATTRPAMRFVHGEKEGCHSADTADRDARNMPKENGQPERQTDRSESGATVLAVGQKAAYFVGTDHFVNVAESGGYFGYDGIVQIMRLMEDAFLHAKDCKSLIQRKGYGCESCL